MQRLEKIVSSHLHWLWLVRVHLLYLSVRFWTHHCITRVLVCSFASRAVARPLHLKTHGHVLSHGVHFSSHIFAHVLMLMFRITPWLNLFRYAVYLVYWVVYLLPIYSIILFVLFKVLPTLNISQNKGRNLFKSEVSSWSKRKYFVRIFLVHNNITIAIALPNNCFSSAKQSALFYIKLFILNSLLRVFVCRHLKCWLAQLSWIKLLCSSLKPEYSDS